METVLLSGPSWFMVGTIFILSYHKLCNPSYGMCVVCVCMCKVYAFVHVGACAHVCRCIIIMCGGQRLMSGVFQYYLVSFSYFFF